MDHRYAGAIAAKDGPSYLVEVSKVWSTEPNQARDVLSIWTEHHQLFEQKWEPPASDSGGSFCLFGTSSHSCSTVISREEIAGQKRPVSAEL